MGRPSSINDILKDLDSVLEKSANDNMPADGGVKKRVMSPDSTQGGGQPAQDAAEVALRRGHKMTRHANPETSHIHGSEDKENVGEAHKQDNHSTGPAAHKSANSEDAAQVLLQKIQSLLSKSANAEGAGDTMDAAVATPQGKKKGMDAQIEEKIEESEHSGEKSAASPAGTEPPSDADALYTLSKKAGELVAENLIMGLLAQNAQPSVEKQASDYVANLEREAAAVLAQANQSHVKEAAQREFALGVEVAERMIASEMQKQASSSQEQAFEKIAELVAAKLEKKNLSSKK